MKPMTDPMSAPAWPPTTYSLPDLWTRAKALFVVLMREVKSVAGLARTRHLTYRQRTDILCRLVPIEKIVRSLLMTEALIFLLMTPQGRRMLATTPKKPPPSQPPVGVKKNTHKITIPMPGWNTIAALQPRIDPRIDAPEAAAHDDPRTPENMACRFRVLAWAHATPEHPPCKEPPRRSWVTTFEPSNFPASEHPASKSPAGANVDSESSARAIARRITAVERVLANREPAIRRLAKFIAGLPRYALMPPSAYEIDTRWWWHGRPEFFNAEDRCRPAVRAFNKLEEPG